MRVREKHAAFRQAVDVRRFDLGVPTETAGPVVEIIDLDEEKVGSP